MQHCTKNMNAAESEDMTRRKVAAYIRVSTQSEAQSESFRIQERYFKERIQGDSEAEFAGLYVDFGVSARSMQNRRGLHRLLCHCRQGRIDRVLCKSVSRFARNTADFLCIIQELKYLGVAVYFEKENLDTMAVSADFLLTIVAAVAQEESHLISQNIRWSIQKKYERGEAHNVPVYGYCLTESDMSAASGGKASGSLADIVEEEAEIVRFCFERAADGVNCRAIARQLNASNVPPPVDKWTGRERMRRQLQSGVIEELPAGMTHPHLSVGWTGARVRSVLLNERYAGCVLLQKYFVEESAPRKLRRNEGQRAKYLLCDHHPAVVRRELYEAVRPKAVQRKKINTHVRYPFSRKLICASCGRFYATRGRAYYPRWFCQNAALGNGREVCTARPVFEEQVLRAVRKGMAERFGKEGQEWVPMMKSLLLDAERGDWLEQYYRRLDLLENVYRLATRANRPEAQTEEKRKKWERQLARLERYEQELERGAAWRAKALAWLADLEGQECGQKKAFFQKLTCKYACAWVLSVTIRDERHYGIRWLDNSCTEVVMRTNIEHYRETEQYRQSARDVLLGKRHDRQRRTDEQ